ENTEAEREAFPEITDAYQAVMQNKVDAVLYDLPNVQYYSNKETGGELKTVGEKLTGEDYGIGFPKGSELRDEIDDELTTLKEKGDELKTVGEKLTGEDYGIGFPKGSELRDEIDDALTTLKEDGTYGDIYEEWFGERPEDEE